MQPRHRSWCQPAVCGFVARSGGDAVVTYLSMAGVDQLNSLPCQVYSALFTRCLDHCRVAEEQHAANINGRSEVWNIEGRVEYVWGEKSGSFFFVRGKAERRRK